LALSFTEVENGWQNARDYFRSIEGKAKRPGLTVEQLERMARIFDKQDKMSEQLAVYEYLISEDPTSFKIPEYADSMIATYKKQEDLMKTEEQVMRFFKYFEAKTSWGVANKGDSDDMQSARQRARQFREGQLDWMIASFHTKAQTLEKEKSDKDAAPYYDKAATYYDLFINSFPDSKDLYEKEFFLAEIVSYQQGKWDLAIDHYTGVLKRDPKGKYSKESAYKVILCGEEKMATANLIPPPEHFKEAGKMNTKAKQASVEYTKSDNDDDFKPIPKKELHETEQSFLEACKNYTEFYPEDAEVPSISFRAAELFIRAGHYAEGIKRLEVIMTYHSNHKFASFAAATLFDANYRLRRWDQMERWGRYMLDKKNFKVLKKNQLEDIIAVSINNFAAELSEKGSKLKKDGNFDEGQKLQDQAVDQMLRFIKEFPKHPKAAIALSNAAFLIEKAEWTKEAVELYECLIRNYKKSPQATEAYFVLGAFYES
jgi:tetratricopeptide (TPR) repeat protein